MNTAALYARRISRAPLIVPTASARARLLRAALRKRAIRAPLLGGALRSLIAEVP
jgi:hypothetical protein